MPFLEALRLALQAIWGAKLRSFFTLLGIIVSVGFLVVVVAVIQGMNAYVKENLTGAMIGTNAFQVRRTPISVGLLDDEQVRVIAKRPLISAEDAAVVKRRASRREGGGPPVGLAHADQRRLLPRPDAGQRARSSASPRPTRSSRTTRCWRASRSPSRTSASGARWR